MASIFLSYRRQDPQLLVARIYNFLAEAFGPQAIFLPGRLYAQETIAQNLQNANVMLIIIGKEWFGSANDEGAPSDTKDDAMHAEVSMGLALARQGHLTIIPVLIDDAAMPTAQQLPSDLTELAIVQGQNAVQIHSDWTYFREDINRLLKAIGEKGIPWQAGANISNPPERMRYIQSVGLTLTETARPPQPPSVPMPAVQPYPPSTPARTAVPLPARKAPAKKQLTGWELFLVLVVGLGSGLWGLISRVVIAIVVIFLGIAAFHAIFPDVGLNEHSSCQQFEQADTNAQNQVLQDMLTAHHDPNPSQDVGEARFSVTLYCNIYGDNAPIDGIYSSGG
jgi:hypothetical protein